MRISGTRVTRSRMVQPERFIVVVDVEAVVPVEDPTEPCYEAETVQFLKQVQQRAEAGDRDWLVQHGRVYERISAA